MYNSVVGNGIYKNVLSILILFKKIAYGVSGSSVLLRRKTLF